MKKTFSFLFGAKYFCLGQKWGQVSKRIFIEIYVDETNYIWVEMKRKALRQVMLVFLRLFEVQYWVTEVLRVASSLSPSRSGVERENEDGWCILCIFKIHIYFQDTHFQDVISTKKYIFRKGNIQLCSKMFRRVHRVHTGFCQKNIKTEA